MKSLNFEFLRSDWPELASLAGFAEQYAAPDPSSSLVKLRSFVEQIAESLYQRLGLNRPFQAGLHELLNEQAFRDAVPLVIVNTMDDVRRQGNRAAHGKDVDTPTSHSLLKECHKLAQWLYLTFTGQNASAVPEYIEPTAEALGQTSKGELKREKKALLQRLSAQEAQMQKLLDDLAAARKEAKTAEASADELAQRLQKAQQVVNVLDFSEEETRYRLIDTQLAEAGWKVGPRGVSNNEVGQEVEVPNQPTDSGIGYADYVLYDDNGAPLAVIEAKKTAKNAQLGQQQAKLYADGLESLPPGQRPVIFFTNGFDIWMWDNAQGYTPRKLFGFYSKDSLQFLVHQRSGKKDLAKVQPEVKITDRPYQIEAITRVMELLQNRRRKSLIVQATGTGKTRVAISLCKSLMDAGWAKRILFLCDRRELRKQAGNAFKEHLPEASRVYVTAHTHKQREHRIYLATYPAMMKYFQTFDVGFFDVVIADESHRSIYNRYRDLFYYFDAVQIGLTATPRSIISHNTYKLFGCQDDDPTADYDYYRAVDDGFLTPFEVETVTTPFLRDGIKYSQMTEAQRKQLEEDEAEPEAVEYEQRQVDKYVFNKDTNRHILRNLMENGIRIAGGSRLGKTIVFARNHNHAVLLQNLFDEMYPQYGGNFCRVIDNYDPRAEDLIDDFKGDGQNPDLTIAISVDMLDTGIDVPEIVNLVFAKPVYSKVKFWQMIGRGTRLCKDLFGPGNDKKKFMIFDHWGNFEYFDESYSEPEPKANKSVQQVLFEARIALAESALNCQDADAFELATSLLTADVKDLPDSALAIREHWKYVKAVQSDGIIKQFDSATRAVLKSEIAPLMQWRNITGYLPAIDFDLLCARLQGELIKGSSSYDNLRDELINRVSQLQVNLGPVKARMATIQKVKSGPFWTSPTVAAVEEVRTELRGIMKFRAAGTGGGDFDPKVLDIAEDASLVERKRYKPKLEGVQRVAYRERVERVLTDLIDRSPALQKIKAGRPVSEPELDSITALVVAQEPDLNLADLAEYYPETAGNLEMAIRSIIGLNADAVEQRFTAFIQRFKLNSTQQRFLDLLKNHIRRYGAIEIEQLYDAPFTSLDKDGLDGVFTEEMATELIELIDSFGPAGGDPDGAKNSQQYHDSDKDGNTE